MWATRAESPVRPERAAREGHDGANAAALPRQCRRRRTESYLITPINRIAKAVGPYRAQASTQFTYVKWRLDRYGRLRGIPHLINIHN